MSTIDEKRVYGDRTGATEAYVASAVGLLRVRVADATVGEFGLCARCDARDVAAAGADRIAIAAAEDVLVGDGESFDGTGFGPAVAVGYDRDNLYAAGPDGRLARLERDDGDAELGETAGGDRRADDRGVGGADRDGADWREIGPEPARRDGGGGDVRAIDGDLVATAAGVSRISGDELVDAGLEAARDVSTAGVPLAATDEGLYRLGNGWMRVLEGRFDLVAADPRSEPGSLARAHAVSGLDLYAFDGEEWRERDRSSVPIVGVGYDETTYAVTERGTFLAADDDEWRSHPLGVGDVRALAVPPR